MTTDIKGVLAYSTVSQIGFMMAGLGTAVAGAASIGWFASLFHMVSHAFFEGLGFLLAGGIIHALGTRDMRLMGGLTKSPADILRFNGYNDHNHKRSTTVCSLLQQRLNLRKRNRNRNHRRLNPNSNALCNRSNHVCLLCAHVQLSLHGQKV